MTDHERVDRHLAQQGRRHSIRVSDTGSVIIDQGVNPGLDKHGKITKGRRARGTSFYFDANGDFICTDRGIKGWWLLRGLGLV